MREATPLSITRCLLIIPCLLLLPATAAESATATSENACVRCHAAVTPHIVDDWRLSKHSQGDVACDACHGDGHTSAEDVAEVSLPTLETCGECHTDQAEQFSRG